MRTSHRLLLRLYHDQQFDFKDVTVSYINRGAPQDRSEVAGPQIENLDRDYMEITSDRGPTAIPYHRITRILYRGIVIWDRESGEQNLQHL
jgi:uncharacterized protein (UPF0248 family)